MQLQIGVPHHTKDDQWQWMRSFGLVVRFVIRLSTSMTMDEKFLPSCKVCDYTFNFMAMSCLL